MTAKAAQKAAEAARATAEEARATADAARKAAEAVRATAETERDAAKAAQAEAVVAQAEAVAAQAEAEAAQAESVAAEMAAKAAQTAAEAARDAAVKAKTAAEAARDESRDGETQAKIDLIAAQSAQAQAERERDKADAAKVEAEQAQAAAETARQEAEAAKIAAEAAKTAAEAAKTAAETAKTQAEADVARLTGELTAANADVARLTGELTAANTEVARLTDEIGNTTEPDSLTARLAAAQAEVTTLKGQLRVSQDEVASVRRQLQDAQGDVTTERQRADDAEDRAQEVQQQAQGLEANQRAEKLLTVLGTFTPPSAPGTAGRVDISVPRKDSLVFKQLGYTARNISASGNLRGARLTRRQGGTQTSVVYTDIELRRSLIKNYNPNPDADATILDVPLINVLPAHRTNYLADEDAVEITSHGFRSSRRLDAEDMPIRDSEGDVLDPVTKTGTSFSGRLHGISGTFQCSNGCTLMATYSAENRLTELNLTGANGVSFKPGSLAATTASTAMVSLCDAPRSACAPTDADYMVFGYWRSEPADVQGTYQFEAFTFGPVLLMTAPAGTSIAPAEYNGTAVGMYVEQNQAGAAVTKKQGEFIADARLAYDGIALTGTIDDFATTPTGGSSAPTTTGWIVKLNSSGKTEFQRLGPDGEGTWEHRYTTDTSAVVGTFESEIDDVLHIAGAFGAKRQQQ